MTGSRRAPASHRRRPAGTYCRNCDTLIKRARVTQFDVWIHVADGNCYCPNNLTGFTATFADPG